MLVLSRYTNERVFVGEEITVVIVSVDRQSGKVRLGFDAPEDVIILREELSAKSLDSPKREDVN